MFSHLNIYFPETFGKRGVKIGLKIQTNYNRSKFNNYRKFNF